MNTKSPSESGKPNLGEFLSFTPALIPVLALLGASGTVEDLPIKEWREIRPISNARPFDRFCAGRISGDSLRDENICDGDYAIVRLTFEQWEIKPGTLVAALTPFGLLIKFIYPTLNGKFRLVAANPLYKDLLFDYEDVQIQGVVVRIERDMIR